MPGHLAVVGPKVKRAKDCLIKCLPPLGSVGEKAVHDVRPGKSRTAPSSEPARASRALIDRRKHGKIGNF